MRSYRLLLVSLALVLGCSDSPYKHAAVTGTVTMDGQPLANVAVAFQPIGDSLTPGAGSSGRTNERGEFTLAVIGGGKGAVVGWHRVEINPTVEGPDDDRRPAPKLRIPPKYNLRSELKFEVKAGTNNVADFPLSSK